MCRSIKQLRRPDQPPTDEELRAAALQFVRKISGFRQPSKANHAAFDAAVEEVTAASAKLLATLTQRAPAPASASASAQASAEQLARQPA